jgi:hypothetical protein
MPQYPRLFFFFCLAQLGSPLVAKPRILGWIIIHISGSPSLDLVFLPCFVRQGFSCFEVLGRNLFFSAFSLFERPLDLDALPSETASVLLNAPSGLSLGGIIVSRYDWHGHTYQRWWVCETKDAQYAHRP